MKFHQIILIMCCFTTCSLVGSASNNYFNLILAFITPTNIRNVNIFHCFNKDVLQISKFMSAQGIFSTSHLTKNHPELSNWLSADTHALAVVMDLKCSQTALLIKKASEKKLFSSLHHWLLLADDNSTIEDDINIPLNSHVVIATEQKYHSSARIVLQDVYKLSQSWPMIFSPPKIWLPGQPYPPSPSRQDFQGLVIRAGIVIEKESWEHQNEYKQNHLWNKVSYGPMQLVSGCSTLGLLSISSEQVHQTVQRWPMSCNEGVVRFSLPIFNYRLRFIFRQPSLSSVANIYILPFSVDAWVTYGAVMVVLTVILFVTEKLHRNMKYPVSDPSEDWSGALLDSIGIICQQGCESTPDNISPRIIFLFLHLLSTFFFTSYSAIIVSLLQTPSSSINTFSDLMKSPLKIIMHDISYNSKYKEYINDSASPLVRELFHERVLSQPKQEVFVTMGQGVELIRTGSYAFHADVNTYSAISNTWLETEKCSIKEVYMYPEFKGGIPIQKGSPYKEHISQRLRWLKEVGLMEREWKLWMSQKPKCQKHDTEFTSVGFQDFYPALMVLAYGLLFASVLMLMEILFYQKST